MKLSNISQNKTQPNGYIINCYASGNEQFNYLHDKNGYIIIQDSKNGYYTYAKYENDKLISSNHIVKKEVLELKDAKDVYKSLVTIKDIKIDLKKKNNNLSSKSLDDDVSVKTPNIGKVNGIVIFVRFKDEDEFLEPIKEYEELFNKTDEDAISMYNYFKQVSYSKLLIKSHFYPIQSDTNIISYEDPNKRGYYEPYNSVTNDIGYKDDIESKEREKKLLQNAVEGVKFQISPSLNIDSDNDGYVDCVTLIIKGNPGGFDDILWPHSNEYFEPDLYINDKLVYRYIFNLSKVSNRWTVFHEMYHAISRKDLPVFPDLYNFDNTGMTPVGTWDILGGEVEIPQQCCAYLKYQYGGWLEGIPEIILPGTYTINPISLPTNNAYFIANEITDLEFFVVEYRRQNTLFETDIPGSGLLVYRINLNVFGEGNAYGPPNEVYIYRPFGTPANDGLIRYAELSSDVNRTSIGGPDNPLFLSDGTPTDIVISNVGSAGDTISFDVSGVATSNLIITKEGLDEVKLEQFFEYDISVLNIGKISSTDPTIITDIIPDNLEIISVDSNKGGVSIEGQTIKIELDEIPFGKSEEVKVKIKVKAIKEGIVTNTATVEALNNTNPTKSSSKTTTIKKTTQTKYTTGILTNMCNRNNLKIATNNKSNIEFELKFTVQNLIDLSDKKEYIFKIEKDTDNTMSISDLPKRYEIIVDNIESNIDLIIIEYCYCSVSKLIREIDLKPM